MKKRFLFSLLSVCSVVLFSPAEAMGQVSVWLFSPSEVAAARSLGFSCLAGGVEASNHFAKLGVNFSGAGESHPTGRAVTYNLTPPLNLFVIENMPAASTSAGKPMVIDFSEPVKQVGLRAGQDPDADVEFRAYTVLGDFLGSVVFSKGTISVPGTFMGIKTDHLGGISKLVVSYREAPEPEQVETLWWTPLQSRQYVTYIGQVAAGQFGKYRFETEIQIQEVKSGLFDRGTTEGEVRFYSQSGSPISFEIAGREEASLPVDLSAGKSLHIKITNTGQPGKIGYAAFLFDYPVAVNAIYRTLDRDGKLIQEAGIDATPGRNVQLLPIEVNASNGLGTAIAIVNTGPVAQKVGFLSRTSEGLGPGNVLNLQPGEQRAFFVDEVLGTLGDKFEGSVFVQGVGGIAAVAIRTVDGVAASSLPVGSLQP